MKVCCNGNYTIFLFEYVLYFLHNFIFKLHLGIEYIRAPELLFQPSMIGVSEAGLMELIGSVLKRFSALEQQQIVQNIFITGGCAQLPGNFF